MSSDRRTILCATIIAGHLDEKKNSDGRKSRGMLHCGQNAVAKRLWAHVAAVHAPVSGVTVVTVPIMSYSAYSRAWLRHTTYRRSTRRLVR